MTRGWIFTQLTHPARNVWQTEIPSSVNLLGSESLKSHPIEKLYGNMLKESDLKRVGQTINEIVDSAEGNIILAHAKDMLFKDGKRELPYAGAGQMDYPAYVSALSRVGYDYFLVVEHVSPETIESAKKHVLAALKSAGQF